ncbi:MAG TPA: GspH/FimT family pseudopilin [Usitatibacter sp.]|nr:GspH/FimT family pseudopilin [Usitatibacter sp.]
MSPLRTFTLACACRMRRAAGFTLTEMMIVLVIVGVLGAIAAPSMADMIRTQRLRTAAFDVFAALTLARSEAIKRNVAVTITPAGGTDWAQGWQTKDANDNVLQNQAAYSSCSTCTMTGPTTVTYASSGRVSSAVGPFNIAAAGLPLKTNRCIVLTPSGNPVKICCPGVPTADC